MKNRCLAFFKVDALDGGSEAMRGDRGMGALEVVLDDAKVERTSRIPLSLMSSRKGDSGFCAVTNGRQGAVPHHSGERG